MHNLCFYTCYFGGDSNYSNLIPPIPSLQYDCYYFTNNVNTCKKLENTKWKCVFLDNIPIYNDSVLDTMNTKELRACPHHFEILNKYDYICWFDTKLELFENVILNYVDELKYDNDKTICLSIHPFSQKYSSVWDEYNTAMQYPRYALQSNMYKKYIEKKLSDGYSEKINIFFCGGFSIRKNCDKTNEYNEFWFENIKECGIEDQISLQFVQQKYNEIIIPVNCSDVWKYFF